MMILNAADIFTTIQLKCNIIVFCLKDSVREYNKMIEAIMRISWDVIKTYK